MTALALSFALPRVDFPCTENSMGESILSVRESSTSLGEAIADALRRRIGQGRAVGIKQFAYDLQVSEQTVWNWLSSNRDPAGRHVVAMLNYFDASFAREIGIEAEVVKLCDKRYAAARQLNEAIEAWRASG